MKSDSNIPFDLERLNAALDDAPAQVIIRVALALGRRPIVSSKFGPQSAVLLHLLKQEEPGIPVVWVDTGFNTRATQDYSQELSGRLALNLKIYRPQPVWSGFPPQLEDPLHALFTRQVKLEPFTRALAELQPDIWFSGIRRQQTEYRSRQKAFGMTGEGVLKVAPLLNWKTADMEDYLTQHRLPVATDYYDPTKGSMRRECGLHLRFQTG
jgi:phosphoadenosine phosphosulfate reductase